MFVAMMPCESTLTCKQHLAFAAECVRSIFIIIQCDVVNFLDVLIKIVFLGEQLSTEFASFGQVSRVVM